MRTHGRQAGPVHGGASPGAGCQAGVPGDDGIPGGSPQGGSQVHPPGSCSASQPGNGEKGLGTAASRDLLRPAGDAHPHQYPPAEPAGPGAGGQGDRPARLPERSGGGPAQAGGGAAGSRLHPGGRSRLLSGREGAVDAVHLAFRDHHAGTGQRGQDIRSPGP